MSWLRITNWTSHARSKEHAVTGTVNAPNSTREGGTYEIYIDELNCIDISLSVLGQEIHKCNYHDPLYKSLGIAGFRVWLPDLLRGVTEPHWYYEGNSIPVWEENKPVDPTEYLKLEEFGVF